MQLTKFSKFVGGADTSGPPFRIPAKLLDANFSMLRPLAQDGDSRQYVLNETPEGWSIKIFPNFPSGSELNVLGVRGGKLEWVPTEECDPA
jgi:hypothetical protein